MPSLANVVHFFPHEFAGLGAWGFACFLIPPGSVNYLPFWREVLLDKFEFNFIAGSLKRSSAGFRFALAVHARAPR
jgi:hypothetical protein